MNNRHPQYHQLSLRSRGCGLGERPDYFPGAVVRATVTYTVLAAGRPTLSGQEGTAVYQNGTWTVGDDSLCDLLTAESGPIRVAGCPPQTADKAGP